jgi:hypothetical protein
MNPPSPVLPGYGWLRETRAPARPSSPLKAMNTMPDVHQPLAELAISNLQRAADEYRSMAATASTTADRDSHTRVAEGFERIAKRRRQASRDEPRTRIAV